MEYLIQRSLYYFFLTREVTEVGAECWNFIAKAFGVKPKDIKTYEAVLANAALDELSTVNDVEMYKNFLNGYCVAGDEFGKAKCEQEAIDSKALALQKITQLFSDSLIKGNRLRSLSHSYERDHIASVLYALQILYLNDDKQCGKFAREILTKELKEGKNSDAGLLLLKLESADASQTANILRGLPDMLLRPDMLKYLARQYGKDGGENIFRDKITIGF